MNINRHNYEEFFLLYVDNELSAADRNAVEIFVQENADLKEELNMLQQTVFDADAFVFDNKTSLLKEEITALQENLLLYIDDELNPADKLNTEKLLQADITANKELAILQQTKLQPDNAVVFANKKILYRKESGKVFDLPWRRIAIAAILLGFGTWATVTFIKTDKTEAGKEVATGQTKTSTPTQIGKTVTPVLPTQQQNTATTNTNTATINANDAVKQATQKNNLPTVTNQVQQNTAEQKDDNIIIAGNDNNKPSNNLPKPYSENINKIASNKISLADVTPTNTTIETIKPAVKIPVVESKPNSNDVVNGYALRANYTESDDGNNLSPEDNKGKKTKLGGFIRKVKRLVDRNTNVTNGNGVQIAGFDIAIK